MKELNPTKTIFCLVLFLLICLSFIGGTTAPKKHRKHKEDDYVIIDGKAFTLVADDYDNWYIKEPVDSVRFIYIPAPGFESATEDETEN